MSDTAFRLDIVSDTICPWCWIGKRRLEAAFERVDGPSFEVRWRPFELNPDVPPGGVPRRDYRIAKFGSWERSLALDAEVREAGAGDGLDFRHARQERTPNTLASHALIRFAGSGEVQDRVVEALFGAYFTDGRDVGETDTLVDIGRACGLDAGAIRTAVTDEALLAGLHDEARGYARGGVNGVPSVLIEGFLLFSGARSPDDVATALGGAAVHEAVLAARAERSDV